MMKPGLHTATNCLCRQGVPRAALLCMHAMPLTGCGTSVSSCSAALIRSWYWLVISPKVILEACLTWARSSGNVSSSGLLVETVEHR